MSTANLSRDEARIRSQQITVETYEFTVDVSRASEPDDLFPVVSTVRFTSKAPDTWIDFLDGVVDAVTINGVTSEVDYDGSRIQLRGLKTDGVNVVSVAAQGRYSRSGQGLHRFVDPADGNTYLYTQYEPADARRVFPNFEQPDLKARHSITLVGPKEWKLISNQYEVAREEVADNAIVTFAPTELLSTYITCIAAGPYAEWRDEWSGTPNGKALTVPLGIYCRQSLAEHMDAENVLQITKQGLDFFNEAFGYNYPWGKYDSIFVPEYNLGAMENPGLVTFTERYVFRSTPVRAQLSTRANTILHEMSHMWFGDLVTPKWWDDLWLKESFAEYMGAHASAEATEFTDAWVAFSGARKNWAYQQDQLPSTHPIVADIPNLEAAKQNFDGITYAKGAAVLKQLVSWVGVEEFFAGARDYFADHAFSVTTLADLLLALEKSSGRDLADWSLRWLQTAGIDRLEPVVAADGDVITHVTINQTSIDAMTGKPAQRPHRLGVGLYRVLDGELVRTEEFELDVPGTGAQVTEAAGCSVPDMVLLNDRGLSYAKVRFDEKSLATALSHVGAMSDPLARTIVWGALWDMTRDAELSAVDYVRAVLTHAPKETDSATLSSLVANAAFAVGAYTPKDQRDRLREEFANTVWELLLAAPAGSDAQTIWARAFVGAAAVTPSQADRVMQLSKGTQVIDGLDMGPDIRWGLLRALAAVGADVVELLDAELKQDNSNEGACYRASALAGRPLAEAKAEAWQQLHTPGGLSNDMVDWIIAGFMQSLHSSLVASYEDRYWDGLEQVWKDFPIEIAQRLVRGLYPSEADIAKGQDPMAHPAVVRSAAWLAAHQDAPGALTRIIKESHDQLVRALRAQAAAM
ncbi:MAG: aminopeptidase N [Propionibacteriaceae bacterium]